MTTADTTIVLYIKQKGSIAGPMFKIPLIGPFFQAIYPKFDAYLKQFASGPLSCVSVFHKYVFSIFLNMSWRYSPVLFDTRWTDLFIGLLS